MSTSPTTAPTLAPPADGGPRQAGRPQGVLLMFVSPLLVLALAAASGGLGAALVLVGAAALVVGFACRAAMTRAAAVSA